MQIKTLLFKALSLRYIWLEGLVTQLTHFFAEDAKFMGMTLLLAQYPLPTYIYVAGLLVISTCPA